MDDIAPELLKKIQEEFEEGVKRDTVLNDIMSRVKKGKATYLDVNAYAIRVGEHLSRAYKNNLSSEVLPDGRMYYNIANKIIPPTMRRDFELVSAVAERTQKSLNEAAGSGIKPLVPEINEDRIRGIVNRVSSEERFDDISWMLLEPIINFSQSIVNDFVKQNAEFWGESGHESKIVRKMAGGCCEWCAEIAGTYTYPDVPQDVYRRHERCKCTVEYDPGDGRRQNVHTKKWHNDKENDIMLLRKILGLDLDDDDVIRNIRENIIPKLNVEDIVSKQEIHRLGSELYYDRQAKLKSKGQYGPSYVTISDEEIKNLVRQYSGTGKVKFDENGVWDSKEVIIDNDRIIGVVVNNITGKSVETSVFKIHYKKRGIHIVPDYPSKKGK